MLSDNLHACQAIVVLRQRKDMVMPRWKEYEFLLQRTAVKSSPINFYKPGMKESDQPDSVGPLWAFWCEVLTAE